MNLVVMYLHNTKPSHMLPWLKKGFSGDLHSVCKRFPGSLNASRYRRGTSFLPFGELYRRMSRGLSGKYVNSVNAVSAKTRENTSAFASHLNIEAKIPLLIFLMN